MSLLLDALRKAEQQKQLLAEQSPGQAEAPPGEELELELVPHHEPPSPPQKSPGNDRLPELPTRLEDLDEQFMAHAPKAPLNTTRKPDAPPAASAPKPAAAPPQGGKETEAARASARLMFEAKQPQQKNNRNFAIIVGVATVLTASGIGGYVWWEMQPKGMAIGNLAQNKLPAAPPQGGTPMAAAQPQTVAPPPPATPRQVVPSAPSAAAPDNTAPEFAATETRQPAVARPAPATQLPSVPIRLTKADNKPDPLLEQAYQAFERGELDLAARLWEKTLATDSRNADALHGLAAIALQRQQPDSAADYYLRALETDPKDALALSGLLALKAPANTLQTESRLKLLLSEQPNSAYLNFALGNLYARDARWADAQQAYFRAHTADAANPDFLFNLAVSLDQLHQPRLAVQYYNQAIAAAARQPAGFDAGRVASRLKELQSALP